MQWDQFFAEFVQPSLIAPSRVVTSAWLGHLPFAFYLVERLRPTAIVELGTHNGASFAGFCQAFERAGLTGHCTAIDTWEGDAHAGRYDDSVHADLTRFVAANPWPFARLLRARFEDALPEFADGSIDLLHIDGLHSYEAVSQDYTSWAPKLSARAVVLFHDTAITDRGFGVHRLWAELAPRFPHVSFEHSAGLGILGHGPDQSALAKLFALQHDPERLRMVQDYFAAVGERIRLAQRGLEQERAIARLKKRWFNRRWSPAAWLAPRKEPERAAS